MKRISSIDVAKQAGVSRATVSYVLNNTKDVKIKPETREKVLEAAAKLGYQPNSIARAMKTKKSTCIGVVSKRKISQHRLVKVLSGIKEILDQHGYSILLSSNHTMENGRPEFVNQYFQGKIDGVILISEMEGVTQSDIDQITKEIIENHIPSVFVDYHINNPNLFCVDIDYYSGGFLAVNYAIEKGYKKIIYLDPMTNSLQESERIHGVTAALNEIDNCKINIEFINIGTIEEECIYKIKKILKCIKKDTIIIASWTVTGFLVLNAANSMKISIPDKLGVIALGESSFVEYSFPSLTTTDLPLHDIGKKSGELILEQITKNSKPQNIKFHCKLLKHDSA